jgi:hypothetical protein
MDLKDQRKKERNDTGEGKNLNEEKQQRVKVGRCVEVEDE